MRIILLTLALLVLAVPARADIDNPYTLDADLTTIGGLTATTGNIIYSSSSAWSSQPPLGSILEDTTTNGTTSKAPTSNAVFDGLALKAATTQSFHLTGFIETVSDKTYVLVIDSEFAGTITETTTDAASGTCTATFNINGTPFGGTANSVSSTETTQAHASANTFAVGDEINMVMSSNSACVDVRFKVGYTRSLAN